MKELDVEGAEGQTPDWVWRETIGFIVACVRRRVSDAQENTFYEQMSEKVKSNARS